MTDEKGLLLPKPSSSVKSDGVNHLLVIAIDEYEHAPRLHNCVRDANALIDVLTKKYRFDPEYVQTIYNGDATRENILETLHRFRSKVKPGDSLLIYFSGHGEMDGDDGFWVPVKAEVSRFPHYISSVEILRLLNKVNCFHICVVVDACFSGAIFLTPKNINPGTDDKRSRWGLASSDNRQVALDGTQGANSPFATALLNHLQSNEVDMGLHLLASNVVDDMRRFKQTPVCQPLNVDGHELGQFIFRLRGQNTFVDPRDGKVYRTVQINGKIWMAQNLDYETKNGRSCYYLNDSNLGRIFGRLYDWDAIFEACPPGWQIPTKEDFEDLADYLRYFRDPESTHISMTAGFEKWNVLLAGQKVWDWYGNGEPITYFRDLTEIGYYWTSIENNEWAYALKIPTLFNDYDEPPILEYEVKRYFLSLRCIMR